MNHTYTGMWKLKLEWWRWWWWCLLTMIANQWGSVQQEIYHVQMPKRMGIHLQTLTPDNVISFNSLINLWLFTPWKNKNQYFKPQQIAITFVQTQDLWISAQLPFIISTYFYCQSFYCKTKQNKTKQNIKKNNTNDKNLKKIANPTYTAQYPQIKLYNVPSFSIT